MSPVFTCRLGGRGQIEIRPAAIPLRGQDIDVSHFAYWCLGNERMNILANRLADVRGAAGRTHAIAGSIRTGLANHDDPGTIERRIRAAENVGLPSHSDNRPPCT